ncbi:DegT/DnrJ/EryC1/StrS family aminotransferase [Tenggerimyces flavus]|uniref:DegT/DnrJ/EryC1/StrS family aminotransferase n=1 Tax=Tenggerimyces flavus TaxID=1708749 RepID=A0ABV7YCC9_9ACTN|nr:DegT/DnrJ/EryC1/StrS family aminotransferase [Tenggerimyces flavus]MBM7783830.1 dTDP-4-amino-4,6-dideoxygalactose transaminase [Tenggerimyces flavus]
MSAQSIPAAKPLIGEEERQAVDRVIASGMVIQGPEVAAFENEFAKLVDGRHCVAVNSGTSALHVGMLAAGVGPGDEVIVPSFTFAATANSVALTGATPVFVDIEPDHFCIDPKAVEAAITSKTVGVMPVHLYGHAADMDALQAIADKHKIGIFEDAAQAHAAKWNGKPVGAFGTYAAFSFYPTKNMTSVEGGMVVTDDENFARQVKLLRNQGMERKYENEVVGFNYRMTDVHAAVGRVQLTKLAGWTEQRQRNAAYLDANLRGVTIPKVASQAEHVYHQYTVRTDDRDAMVAKLTEAGIGTGVYYPIPNHELPSFGLTLDLPETAKACREVFSLPVHPSLSTDDLERIVTEVSKAAGL